ncbi:MAG TPA: Zn-dependent membrane protease, partial [Frankiaceae bacterium]|nr:Zn-dependent membrane protease [Frankiaceae bacterium]
MLFVLNKPALLLGIIAALYIGVVVGSAATVLTARALGDPMGQREHRLSLNPTRHVQIYSAVMMVLGGFGWAEQVPLNDRWRARRFHVSAAVLARPIAYAALALAAAAGAKGVLPSTGVLGILQDRIPEAAVNGNGHSTFATQLLLQMSEVFASLCVISLIPVPPTDLGRVIFTLGGNSIGWQKARYQLEERNLGLVVVLALLLLPIAFTGFPS